MVHSVGATFFRGRAVGFLVMKRKRRRVQFSHHISCDILVRCVYALCSTAFHPLSRTITFCAFELGMVATAGQSPTRTARLEQISRSPGALEHFSLCDLPSHSTNSSEARFATCLAMASSSVSGKNHDGSGRPTCSFLSAVQHFATGAQQAVCGPSRRQGTCLLLKVLLKSNPPIRTTRKTTKIKQYYLSLLRSTPSSSPIP